MRESETTASAQAGQAAAPSRRPLDETASLGDEIYERDIRSKVEATHHGEFVAIDVDSGDWAVADTALAASDTLRERRSALNVWAVRVGYRGLRNFGVRFLRRAG